MFWQVVHYGWFVFMGLAVFSVIGGAIWDSTAPKRRLKQIERERLRREKEAAKAAEAAANVTAAQAAEASGEAATVSVVSQESPVLAETPAGAPPAVMEDEDVAVVEIDETIDLSGGRQT